MRLKIEICLDNAAFDADLPGEVLRILQVAAGDVATMQGCPTDWISRLLDSNGNIVGTAKVVED